jgi:hypothetical protein
MEGHSRELTVRVGGPILLVLLLSSATVIGAPTGAAGGAEAFGAALMSGDLKQLRSVLPEQGRVRLKLAHFGPADGQFSAGQVEAIFKDFLANGSVQAFEIVRIDGDDVNYGVVAGRVSLVDRSGRPRRVALLLSLQPEADRWVLREVKETEE